MTQREFFNAIVDGTLIVKEKNDKGEIVKNERSIFDNDGFNLTDEIKDFARDFIKKLDNKNDKRKENLSAKQKNNEVIKESILELMQDGEKRSAKMIVDIIEALPHTQKASPLLKQLVDSGKLTSTEEKLAVHPLKSKYIR